MRCVVLVLPLVALLSLACRKEPAQLEKEAVATVATPQSLATYCGKAPCRSYADSEAAMKQRATSGGMCLDAHLSRCGGIRGVEYSDGYSRWEEWFDASGKMIGAKTWEDYRPEGGLYGTAPGCQLEVTERLCPPPVVLDASAG